MKDDEKESVSVRRANTKRPRERIKLLLLYSFYQKLSRVPTLLPWRAGNFCDETSLLEIGTYLVNIFQLSGNTINEGP